jgi:hypothetical protein
MNPAEFRAKIKKPYRVDDVVNIVICCASALAGLYFAIKIWIDGVPTTPDSRRFLIFIVPALLLFAGVYGFWRIPKSYQVKQIISAKPIVEKHQAIYSFLEQYKITWKREEKNYLSIRYRNRLFTHVDVRFYFDESQVLFNAEGADLGGLKGIIDFGAGKRTMRKLEDHFHVCL